MKKITKILSVFFLFGIVLSGHCASIVSFSPTSGVVGTTVTINGTNFSTTLSENTVTVNNIPATVTEASATALTIVIPNGTSSGAIRVTVGIETATSSSIFTVLNIESCNGISKNNSKHWYFGNQAAIRFDVNGPTALSNSAMTQVEGVATMSDANGNLLFYTNGITVYNRNHTVMQNGNGLLSDSSNTQAAFVVPSPGNPNQYYIITPNPYFYSIVDMTLDNGNGAIISSAKNILLTNETSEKIAGLYAANQTDIWLITYASAQMRFNVYKITSEGIVATPVVSQFNSASGFVGYMKVSPSGTKIAMANFANNFHIYDFDAATGIVSNMKIVNHAFGGFGSYGIEFSPNSNLVYAADHRGPNKVTQFDITLSTPELIAASATELTSNLEALGGLQLGPDNKIYVAKENSSFLGVVNNPDTLGLSADYVTEGVNLSPKTSNLGLPGFVASALVKSEPYIISFSPSSGEAGDSVTISGFNFNASPSNNNVHINGIPAVVTAASETSLTVTIPENATVGRISVAIGCGVVASTNSFVVTESNSQGGCWQTISAGGAQTLAITPDGSLWGWGENGEGQLGNGTNLSNPIKTQIGTDTNWLKVITNVSHTLAIKTDGTLWAWGDNQYGQLGNNSNTDTNVPVQIGSDTNWKDIAAGVLHSIALKTDGTIWSWGGNMFNQLGDGSSINRNFPAQVGLDTNWFSINSNNSHTLAIKTDGTLWGWGGNGDGQLGDGTITFRASPVQIGNDSDWRLASTGGGFSVGIKNNGTLWSWGDNLIGQLGDGSTTDKLNPVQIGNETDWKSISNGYFFTIALKNNGSLLGWGLNSNGQLGNASGSDALFPTPIGNSNDWRFIVSGVNHTVALNSNGALSAWGVNNSGGLGDGTTIMRNTPTAIACPVLEFTFVQQNIAAGGLHSLFVCESGITAATGNNFAGQLGIGTSGNIIVTPVATNGLTDIISVAARDQFSLFLKSDGTVWGAGGNSGGELGIGTIENVNLPVQIPNFNNVIKIATGFYHSLFLKSDGTVWACGRNFSGELGIGNQVQQNSPVKIESLSDVVDIAAGDNHSMFLLNNGTVKSCGDNQDYALGLGYTQGVLSPTLVDIEDVATIGAGFRQSIFVKKDGTVWAAGNNSYGKLGVVGSEAQQFPSQVVGLSGIIYATAGQYHSLYLKNDGTAWGSGFNAYGQLGNGNNEHQPLAVQVTGISNVTGIAASGYYHSVFSTADNQFFACGQNGGTFGNGNGESSNLPVLVIDNCLPLAVEDTFASKMVVYPNPSRGIFNVDFPSSGISTIIVSDLNGRIVHQSNADFSKDNKLNLENLQTGMYILKINNNGQTFTQKIIKQ